MISAVGRWTRGWMWASVTIVARRRRSSSVSISGCLRRGGSPRKASSALIAYGVTAKVCRLDDQEPFADETRDRAVELRVLAELLGRATYDCARRGDRTQCGNCLLGVVQGVKARLVAPVQTL